jgi:para-nitrobenzyl esterase
MGAIVETRYGKLEGFERGGLQVFRGIPFARPPVGELRFRSPEPPEPWSGLRSAVAFGASAPQRDMPLAVFPGWDVGRQDEDCLYLNVTTPAADGGRRPVLVWIHGGGFSMGSGSQAMYDVAPLVRRGDVVVVTVNYRLGPLGFLHLDDLLGESFGATGNAGIEDQVAALEWVRDNVAAFGGDPGRVTIFGESAGGMSVGTLLGMPSAVGLFRGAVAQSGAAQNIHTRDLASRIAELVLDSLGIAPGDAERLREVDTEQILQAQDEAALQQMARPGAALLPFQPVVDGKALPKPPIEAIAEGLSADVAVLVGSTRDEWNLFGMMDPRQASMDEAEATAAVEAAVGDEAKRLLEAYRSARAGTGGGELSPRQLYLAIQTDRIFRIPAVRLAEAQSRHQVRTYQYLFTWESPAGDLGACHGIDIPFVFGLVEGEGAALFTGSRPEAQPLAERSMDAWLAFARTGSPGHPDLGDWPAFDTERRATMFLGASCELVDAPFDAERRAWQGLI